MSCELTHTVLNKPIRWVILSHFANEGTEAQIKSNLPKITQRARSRARVETRQACLGAGLLTTVLTAP